MSLWRQREIFGPTPADMIPRRTGNSVRNVSADAAMHIGAAWACIRLRANLMSSFPIDVFRSLPGGLAAEVAKPQVLIAPGGPKLKAREYMYSSQVDLDRCGNAISLILARDGAGLPSLLKPLSAVNATARIVDGEIVKWRIGSAEFDPVEIWHEKQYTVAGCPLGLSPVMYAAYTLGEFQSIQQFSTDWFDNGTLPSAVLKNSERKIAPDVAEEAKERYRATVANGDVFVIGNDWEFNLMKAEAAGTNWLAAKQFAIADIARFFDCPGDLIDAAASGQSITYANLTQRNLQFLIMHLGPAVARREEALSDWLPKPRYVKLNTDSLLRMDPAQRSSMLIAEVAGRLRAPSEARALNNLAPFTDEQLAEFDRLFGKPEQKTTITKQGA